MEGIARDKDLKDSHIKTMEMEVKRA